MTKSETYRPRHLDMFLPSRGDANAAIAARRKLDDRLAERRVARSGRGLASTGYFAHVEPRPEHGRPNSHFDQADLDELLS